MNHVYVRKHLIMRGILAKGTEMCFRSGQLCYASAELGQGVELHSLRLDFGNPATAFCPLSSLFLFLYLKPLFEKQLCSREIQPHFPNQCLSLSPCQEFGGGRGECWVWQLSTHHYGLTVPSALWRRMQSRGVLPKQAPRGTVTYLLIWPVKLYL